MKNKTLFKLGYLFYAIVLITHVLIIAKAIPYTWINGGRSPSYNDQLQISAANIVITFIGFAYVFANQKIQKLQTSKLFKGFRWALVPFWSLSLVLQFLGTTFEIFVMSPIVLFGLYVHVQLARLK